MAGADPSLDREVREALIQEARERIQIEGPIAEIGHLAVAALVVLLVVGRVPPALLVGWCAVMVAATLYRYTVRLRIRVRGYDKASRLALQLTVGTVAVAWGLGVALFAQWLPFADVALLLVVLAGLQAAATTTLSADRVGFRIFLLGTLLPPLAGIAAGELGRTRVVAMLLVVVYGAAMWFLQELAHTALLERLTMNVQLVRSESKAASERAHRDALFASAPVAIAVVDEQGFVRDANPGFEALFGYSAAEARGRALNDLVVPSGELSRAEHLDRTVRAGEPVVVEVQRRRKDGQTIAVRASAARVQGAPSGVDERDLFVMYEDMADELRARRALQEAKEAAERLAQMRSAFLANMSHEIRTPMNAILGLTEVLLDSELSAEQRHSLALIQNAGEALLTLLNDILDLSKIEADSLRLEAIPFDLWRLVDQIVSLLAVRANQKGIELKADIAPTVPEQVRGDPTRLRQVLTNLIGNAVKFTHQGGVVVSLSAAPAENARSRIRFAVRDTGIGIPPEQRALIFQPFSQGDASVARRYGGSGLGLSIARRLVEMMGGTLEVTSEVNQGSEFSFTIEMPLETAVPAPLPATGAVPLEGLAMLVVDDNESNRRIVREMLGSAGVTVDEAADADAGLTALRAAAARTPYALAILDAQMPGRDGFEMAEMVRRDGVLKRTRLLMLTSAAQRGDGERCRERRIHGYLAKPVSRSDLLDLVSGVLGAAESEEGPFEVVTRHRIHESRRRLKILLAEDNPVNQEVAATMLRKRGYDVEVVENGLLAVERVRATRYDVVLMDIEMPELNGYQAAVRIRAIPACRDLPIVALTGHVRAGERERCLAHGMNAYLSKPFKPFELFTTVESWGRRTPAASAPPPGAAPPLGLDTFRKEMTAVGAGDAVDGIIASFAEHLGQSMQEMGAAVAAGNAAEVARIAHAFKSSAAQLGATKLAGLLKEIEEAAKANGDMRAAYDQLRAEAAAVEKYLATASSSRPAP
ncbi:MAG TPA: response regulator [Gemmatimonadales bacterium]|nr:response regulator [Gemmatimonadales bacterium]